MTPSATLIGDVVDSRAVADRRGLHRRLTRVLSGVNSGAEPVEPLRITVGDEFQGRFARVGEALAAALGIRLALLDALEPVDVRFGVGWGPVQALDGAVQDGPGWWAAREAIEWVGQQQRRPGTRAVRTAYRTEAAGPDPASLNAALLLRDAMIAGLDARSLSVLHGLLSGRSQRDLAESLGISPSAVSQRVRADGLAMLVSAERGLEGVR